MRRLHAISNATKAESGTEHAQNMSDSEHAQCCCIPRSYTMNLSITFFFQFALWAPIKDITLNWIELLVVILLESLWLLLTFLVRVSGCPR